MRPVLPFLSAASELALSVLAPPRCAACEGAVPIHTVFCAPCAATLERVDEGAPNVAAFSYGGAVARAIARFKYEGRADLARPLASLLLRGTARLAHAPPDVVVPVPLHPTRLAERGFNQAALLARPVARQLGARFSPRALARSRDTARQASLAKGDRVANVDGAFVARLPRELSGARVLLVDDVRTTGATLAACASAARSAGAREVRTAVVARAELP